MEEYLVPIFLFGGLILTAIGMFMFLSPVLAGIGVYLFLGGLVMSLLTAGWMMFD